MRLKTVNVKMKNGKRKNYSPRNSSMIASFFVRDKIDSKV